MQAYGGANFVPIAVPNICLQNFELNSNKLFLRANSATLIMSSLGTVLSINLSY